MDKDLRHCIHWLSSTDDLDYADDNFRSAYDYFFKFYKSKPCDSSTSEILTSVRDEFLVLSDKFEEIYDHISSIINKLKSLEDGQTGT